MSEYRRRTGRRSKVYALRDISRRDLRLGALLYPTDETIARPQTRADCANGPRPCPFVSCRHHLYLDVNPKTGSIKLNFPDREPWELTETCALDVGDQGGGLSFEEVGDLMNITRGRVQQIEDIVVRKLKRFARRVA